MLKSKQVCSMIGGVTLMTLHRRMNDPDLDFPKPKKMAGMNYWLQSEIERWIAKQMAAAE